MRAEAFQPEGLTDHSRGQRPRLSVPVNPDPEGVVPWALRNMRSLQCRISVWYRMRGRRPGAPGLAPAYYLYALQAGFPSALRPSGVIPVRSRNSVKNLICCDSA